MDQYEASSLDMPVLPLLSFQPRFRRAVKFVMQSSYRQPGCAVLLCLLALMAVSPAAAVTHAKVHKSHRSASLTPNLRYWHISKYSRMFPGSHDLLVQQNEELNRLQLPRIYDEGELVRYEVSQVLVPVNETEALKIAADLPESRRYCRPWTRDFLQDFSQAFYNQFHSPLQVNSLVRTVEQQQRLRRYNRYAAPEWGDTASTHLTGVTFDLSRRGLTGAQYGWILAYMLPLKESGMVDPIEESQPVLHVVVFEKYSERLDQKDNGWSEANEPTEASMLTGVSTSQSVGVGASQP
ncbi:MAG: DUF5715 family protein [Candidatus Korobacteraceae bacterium]